jgi:hypothetical protein
MLQAPAMEFLCIQKALSSTNQKSQIMHLGILTTVNSPPHYKYLDTNMYLSEHALTPTFEVLSSHT